MLQTFWPWVWLGGGLLVIFLVGFTYFEARGLNHPESNWTLSKSVSTLGAVWPYSIFLWGMLAGGLAFGLGTHLFWSWAGNPLTGGG